MGTRTLHDGVQESSEEDPIAWDEDGPWFDLTAEEMLYLYAVPIIVTIADIALIAWLR